MGQTIEAINHSKVAGVPIIVAINKIDKPALTRKNKTISHGTRSLSENWEAKQFFVRCR